jgi:tetratricopeptide (TPR) repeat protein
MPKRPRSHEIDDESVTEFRRAIGKDLLFREITKNDYGIDGEVEVFEAGSATGIRFAVQLKATDEPDLSKALKKRIKLTTSNYWRAQPIPTLVVRYHAPTESIYAKWFHQFDPYYDHAGDTHLTFNWSKGDKWTEASPARFASEAERAIKAKSANYRPPIPVRLKIESSTVRGTTRTDLALAVEEAVAKHPELLLLVDDDSAMLQLAISNEMIKASFAGISTSTIHFEDEDDEPVRAEWEIAADLLVAGALSLARVGHSDLAARVAVANADGSLLVAIPPLSMELAMALARTRRIYDAIDLAEQLSKAEDNASQEGAFAFVFSVVEFPAKLDNGEVDRISGFLTNWYDATIAQDEGQPGALAALHGTLMSKVDRPAEAAKWFSKALAANDDLNGDSDFLARHAGVLCLSGSFSESVDTYAKAIAEADGDVPHLAARRADALVFAGKYEEALVEFEAIETNDTELSAWIYVKKRALSFITSWCDVAEQARDIARATQLAAELKDDSLSEEESDELMEEVLEADAISGLGWFNYGVDQNQFENFELAKHAFLVTAVTQEGDAEAWVNVALLAMETQDHDLLATSILTASRLNIQKFIREFSRQIQGNGKTAEEREEMLTLILKLADPSSYEAEQADDFEDTDHR